MRGLFMARSNERKVTKTRGQVESEVTEAIIGFEKEYLGRGPVEARTFFVEDMIIVRLRGILTPAELKLAETPEGRTIVKESRRQLFNTSREVLDRQVEEIVGCQVISLHKDISTLTGERIIIFTVDVNLDKVFGSR
jgi:uncharacterized protein YbcI